MKSLVRGHQNLVPCSSNVICVSVTAVSGLHQGRGQINLYPRPPTALLFEGALVVSAAVLDWKAHAPPSNLGHAAATHAVSVVAVPFPDPRFRDTESYDLPESSSLHFCMVCKAVGVGDCLSSTADYTVKECQCVIPVPATGMKL